MSEIVWTDDHCHLHMGERPTIETAEAVAEAHAVGVTRMITVGCDVADSRKAIEVAREHDGVFATAGVHPHEAAGGIEGLEALLRADGVVAIGECGLDYHYEHSPREEQKVQFAAQIALAHQYELPLVIHSRAAWDDTFEVLAAEGVPEHTVFHCFTGGAAEAKLCLDIGAHLSISGIVTFKTADDIREAVGYAPLDRLMVETDAPYLAPVPHRGSKNKPSWVPVVGAAVAELKGVAVAEVARSTWGTATEFYGLPETP